MELTEEQKKSIHIRLLDMVNDYDTTKGGIDDDCRKYGTIIEKLPQFIESVDKEFEELTSITPKDVSFLVFASTLQVFRQWLTSILKTRLSDKDAASKTPFHSDDHSDRRTKQYYATKTEIANNPVPFDAIRKSQIVKKNRNPKLNGFNHRYTALGHDPLLGLVFGTANIMTKTITVAKGKMKIETYHVGSGIASNGRGIYKVDMLTNQASTPLMFEHICSRIKAEGQDGWEALAMSLGKEIVHLLSDVRTAKSLPIPFLSAVSPDLSRILNLCGIDALSSTTFTIDFLLSKMIDFSIAYMHSLCYNPDNDGPYKTYQIRTKNIVYYSNLISITSTTIQTLFRAYMGDPSAISKFDFGGAISSWNVVWNTPFIISDMKSEYIRNKTINYLGE